VELLVENDGNSPLESHDASANATTSGSGVGLSATRARLMTAYGDRASLRLVPREGSGARVRITLPRSVRAVEELPLRRTKTLAEAS
jgi:sensor histidine kinase YesM